MDKLELIICHDDEVAFEDALFELEKCHLPKFKSDLGIDLSVSQVSESQLENPDTFAQNALLYVHGGFEDEYVNVTRVRNLAEKRPDLKFIIDIDPSRYQERHFKNPEDYELVKACTRKGLCASDQITVSHEEAFLFLTGEDETCLREYVKQLKGV